MSRYYIFPVGEESDTLEFNVTKSIRRNLSATATMNPIENGSDVADHIRNQPAKITFTGTLVEYDALSPDTAGYEEYITTLTSWRDSKKSLVVCYDEKLTRDLNCYITNFSMDRDSKVSDGWNVSLELQQVELGSQAALVTQQFIVEKDLSPKVQELAPKNSSTKELTSEEIRQNAIDNILSKNLVGI